jgi:hypothetical protein
MTPLFGLLSFLLLSVFTVDAQLDSDAGENVAGDRRPLMRAHVQQPSTNTSGVVHLTPSGDLVAVRAHAGAGKRKSDPATADNDLCKYSYLLGEEDKNDCLDTEKHENILDQEDCKFAADKAGACKGPCGGCETEMNIGLDCDGNIRVDATGLHGRYNTHPLGCFKAKGANEFYYNPGQTQPPTHPEENGGTPVCQRSRFLLGGKGQDNGCPTSYEKVIVFEDCRTAADCEGYNVDDDDFMVGIPPSEPNDDQRPDWMRTYDGKPKGCFLKEDEGYAYFNKPQDNTPSGILQSNTPICFVTRWVAEAE